MRNFVITIGLLVATSTSDAQIDFSKLNKAARQFNQIQQQVNQLRGQQSQPGQGQQQPTQRYKQLDPNSSGDRNRGDFDGNGFLPPNNNFRPPQGNIPGQNFQPGRTYPGGNVYPRQTYPGGMTPQGNTYPSGTVIRNGLIYQNGRVIGTANNSNRLTYPSSTPKTLSPSNGYNGYSDPPTASALTYSGLPIVIRCNDAAQGICNYELITAKGSVFPYTIKQGQKQNLSETTSWVIRYRSTPTSPQSTYKLRGGKTYEMRKSASGWQLYMVP